MKLARVAAAAGVVVLAGLLVWQLAHQDNEGREGGRAKASSCRRRRSTWRASAAVRR